MDPNMALKLPRTALLAPSPVATVIVIASHARSTSQRYPTSIIPCA